MSKFEILGEKHFTEEAVDMDELLLYDDFINYNKEDLLIKLGNLTLQKKRQ